MPSQDPPPNPEGGPAGGAPGADAADDALRRLEARLDRASDAAERLLGEAAGSAARAARAAADRVVPDTPASGWQLPNTDERGAPSDTELVLQLLRSVRDLVPEELERRLAEALRELLLALRALIDWYLERSEPRRAEPSDIQDIPIS